MQEFDFFLSVSFIFYVIHALYAYVMVNYFKCACIILYVNIIISNFFFLAIENDINKSVANVKLCECLYAFVERICENHMFKIYSGGIAIC